MWPTPQLLCPKYVESLRDLELIVNSRLTHKSELLNVSLPHTLVPSIRTSFPIQWQDPHIRYLGILILTDLSQIFPCNFSPLLSSLTSDISKWSKMSLYRFGKMAALKMDVLPIYHPILLPDTTYSSPQIIIFFRKLFLSIKCIWGHSHPRLKSLILMRRKEEGGVSLSTVQLFIMLWPYLHALQISSTV